ncbi:MAG: hypothetical protein JSW67_12575 [Candidatus Latescibacterota bacterium]|nr:MAG: hypothetical protein JSW67_12575 [Candidatus Latescibacterota bacterium]
MSQPLRRVARTLLAMSPLLVAVAHQAAAEGNGLLGIYFDDRAGECETTASPGQARTAYVVFTPDGDTRGGVTGASFRITVENGDGFLFHSEVSIPPIQVGDALGPGTVVAGGECLTGLTVPIMRFQAQALGGGTDVILRIEAHEDPKVSGLPCPLMTLCDGPIYTKICVQTGRAVINPSGAVACGSSSESTDWGRVKALYR